MLVYTYLFINAPLQLTILCQNFNIDKIVCLLNLAYTGIRQKVSTVDSRYLEFQGTL